MKNQHNTMRSWRWLPLLASPLLAVIFVLAFALPALADTVTNLTFELSGSLTNSCNGETVVYSGDGHEVVHTTLDGSGGFHLEDHVNLQDFSGVGSLGNNYRITEDVNFEFNGKVGMEETETESFLVVSQGSAPNFVFTFDFHFTVNPDGTVTSFHDNFRTECRG